MRAVTGMAVGLLLATGLVGCAQPAAPRCDGGDVRLRQGVPTDLPGGGSAGFTETRWNADPPTVHLLMGGDVTGDPPYDLVVGDAFTIDGTAFTVACIGVSVVTLDVG